MESCTLTSAAIVCSLCLLHQTAVVHCRHWISLLGSIACILVITFRYDFVLNKQNAAAQLMVVSLIVHLCDVGLLLFVTVLNLCIATSCCNMT